MKKEVSVPIIIVTVVALLGVIGFMVFKANQPSAVYAPDPRVMRDAMVGSSGKRPAPEAGKTASGSGNVQEQMMRQYGGRGEYGGRPGPR